jgi:acyl carrier protein
MELNTFIDKFAGLFDYADKNEFRLDTDYKEIDEWSSLTALSVIAMIDEEYDVRVKSDDFRNTTTIEELFRRVESKKAASNE